jgi:hypothetical protein
MENSNNKHQRRDDQRPATQLTWDDDHAEPVRTWRERIGAAADFPLHAPTDVERAMEAEIAELRALVASECRAAPSMVPLDEHTKFILGRPNFTCIRAASRMRQLGHDIEPKADAEQAAVIHLMLTMYQKHGAAWREHCHAYLQEKTRFD